MQSIKGLLHGEPFKAKRGQIYLISPAELQATTRLGINGERKIRPLSLTPKACSAASLFGCRCPTVGTAAGRSAPARFTPTFSYARDRDIPRGHSMTETSQIEPHGDQSALSSFPSAGPPCDEARWSPLSPCASSRTWILSVTAKSRAGYWPRWAR